MASLATRTWRPAPADRTGAPPLRIAAWDGGGIQRK